MKPLIPADVKYLNALAKPKDSLERLWADRYDGSRQKPFKVTRTRVYFPNDFDGSEWSEPIANIKAFRVLKLITVLD